MSKSPVKTHFIDGISIRENVMPDNTRILNLRIAQDEFLSSLNQYVFPGQKIIYLAIIPRKIIGPYGNTHYCKIKCKLLTESAAN